MYELRVSRFVNLKGVFVSEVNGIFDIKFECLEGFLV